MFAASGALLLGTGGLRHEFASPARRQSQCSAIRYRQRMLDPRDVTLVDGLPAMTMERTIADLIEEVGDLSLVADALRDASRKRNLDLDRLRSLLAPLAQRNGFKKGDGAALLDRLMEIAGIDAEAVARRVAADASLGARVAANYFAGLSKEDLDRALDPGVGGRNNPDFDGSSARRLQRNYGARKRRHGQGRRSRRGRAPKLGTARRQ